MTVVSSTSRLLPIPPEATSIEPRHEAAILSVTGAARLLGVHANTIRAWTDQGRLRCLRINERGDRRYRVADLEEFLREAGLNTSAFQPFVSRFRSEAIESPSQANEPLGITTIAPAAASNGRASAPKLVALSPPPSTPARISLLETSDSAVSGERALMEQIRDQLRTREDLGAALSKIAASVLETHHFRAVGIAEWRDGQVLPRVVEGIAPAADWLERADTNLIAVCIREGRAVEIPTPLTREARSSRPPATLTVYAPVGPFHRPWGVVLVETSSDRPLTRQDRDLIDSLCSAVEVMSGQGALVDRVKAQQRRSVGLASITVRMSSNMDLPALTQMLVEEALPLFEADRAAVWRLVDGHVVADASHNLSEAYIDEIRQLTEPPAAMRSAMSGKAMVLRDVTNDPRAGRIRSAVQREGFHTIALAPLMADTEATGLLAVYHDGPYEWSQQDLDLLEALGTQAGIALRNARNYQLMATWAAQLQSIQQLGTRLNRWGTVNAIGQAIAAELRQLIDYHNVRVYRVHGQVVEPVAWRGEIGEYTAEERETLRLKVGEGITGWVAQNGIPQYLPDAAHDPRSQTIPGTEAELDESMLIAPMLYEDHVLGVIVLSKLGVNQFTGDDLRYLEIYASIAAQAMVNADATEQLKAQSDRLARQLSSQRELMQVTESILSTLDPRTVVEEIADRLGGLLRVDNIAIGINDTEAGVVRTLFARGVNADMYMDVVIKDTEGVAGWVLEHGEALLIPRTQDDARFINFADRVVPGAVMVAPLRSRDKVTGTLLLERLGEDAHFEEEEFELLQLFAGHVSIALQNAEAHHAVEIRAQTDALTGLKNQGTFQEYLQMTVKRGNPFSLLIVDLDDFKSFNDRRGHEAGNLMLANIAKALRTSCRDSDEVFRYGGDEFALILPNTDEAGAMRVAAKVGRAVRNAPAPGTRRLSGVTCSIGAAAFPADASDRESILLAADRACYVAKRNGRNRAVTSGEALALAGDVLPEGPTPVDEPELPADAA